ncbi:MAG TPA: ABC transporter permease [Hanamia sp.]|nr:ABC transporter permease [Hanamia sp.]
MFKNYFKTAWRNLQKNKGFSFINITGLAIGMASAILILLWIQNEMLHDAQYPHAKRLYMMYNHDKFNGQMYAWGTTPIPLAPALKQNFPEVEDAVRVKSGPNYLLTAGDKKLLKQGNIVDSGFLKMFSFPMLYGNPVTALDGIYHIVITKSLSKALFGNENPMGKTIKIDSTDMFTVTGVLKELPNTTSFKFDYLLPFAYLVKLNQTDDAWENNQLQTYVLLNKGSSHNAFDAKVKNITVNHTKNSSFPSTTTVFSYPVNKTYLYGKSDNGQLVGGRIDTVRLFGVIALFILLIACINFMNLSTARSEKRAKEVGIRKVVGAQKSSLIAQFIAESILLALLAGIIAILIVQLTLPYYNRLVDKQLFLNWKDASFWLELLGFIFFTGIIAGSYPAFFLSTFKPIKVLKGVVRPAHSTFNPRKILVVLQFTFAITLIISTIIILHQINYAQQRETGYNKNNIIYTSMQGDVDKNYNMIKQSLLDNGAAVGVTKSMSPITQSWSDSWGFSWEGSTEDDKKLDFARFSTDGDFMKVFDTKLVEGRDIDLQNYPGDSNAILLNETAIKKMRLKEPVIGQFVHDEGNGKNMEIVGVVKDFIIGSPYDPVSPLMINGPGTGWFNVIHIKMNPAKSVAQDLKLAEDVFKQYNPQYPFDYKFVDSEYAKKFEDTQRTATLAALFAGLTIIISCLGLFGLAAYMAENRIKEIGVRKVLGASVTSITTLLSKDFLKLVIISIAIASPIAWYAMHQWLQGYSYRVKIDWWVFAGAGIIAVAISLITVSFQAIKAAMANPVKSLRSE